jgi:hypothetical protein
MEVALMTEDNTIAMARPDYYSISDTKYVVLRTEIIETEKSSADFLKWKLIAVATVASVAVGFLASTKEAPKPDIRLIICLAPLICAYADMVGVDLAVRTMLIANFLWRCGDPYETHIHNLRERGTGGRTIAPTVVAIGASAPGIDATAEAPSGRRPVLLGKRGESPFNAATTASFAASVAVSTLIIGGGLVGGFKTSPPWPLSHVIAFIAAGSMGVAATLYLWALYDARLKQTAVRSSAEEENLAE